MKPKEYKLEIAGKTFFVTIDDLAEQANGSVFVRVGDTVVFATATMSSSDPKGLDFFPLTVEFGEKYYAVGKILGSRFVRREGRPSDESVLAGRLIDRSLRPLFPKNLKREVQIIVDCYSFDEENDPDVPALLAASLALGISDIPFEGPVAPIMAIKNNNGFIINPTYKEKNGTDLEIFLAGIKEGDDILINMIEAQGNETKEKEILEAIKFMSEAIKNLVEFQEKIIKECGREKIALKADKPFPEIEKAVEKSFQKKLEEAFLQNSETKNKEALESLKEEIRDFIREEFGEEKLPYAEEFISRELKNVLKKIVFEKGVRPDGRRLDQIRKTSARVSIFPRTHGSGLFIRGKTKAMSLVTLGSPSDQRLIEGMEFRGKKGFMHHYNFPPYCSGEIKPIRGPSRREIGHGMLAEKALIPLVPNFEDFPYTIRVVTEILSSNGSTSMASVSSSSLALMDAGVPVKKPAAGIAIGIVQNENDYRLLTDIQGPEDHLGGMDFKVAGTRDGITAIQLDVKIRGLTQKMIDEALELARNARTQILDSTDKTLSTHRSDLSPLAPKIEMIKIDPQKIGEVVGSGGRVINEIIEKCEVAIDIEDDGNVFVSSHSSDAIKRAVQWIEGITREIRAGEIFQGKVIKILDFGAIVEILPKREGMVHISELAPYRVGRVEDIVRLGDLIPVKVISVDDSGKMRLSLKEAANKTSQPRGKFLKRSRFNAGRE